MKILVDSDFILELWANRNPYQEEVNKFFSEILTSDHIEAYITDQGIYTLTWILSDLKNTKLVEIEKELLLEKTINFFADILDSLIKLPPISEKILLEARKYSIPDLPSAIELAFTKILEIDAIITQNPDNFTNAKIPIWSIKDLIYLQQRLESLEQIIKLENIFELNENNTPIIINEAYLAQLGLGEGSIECSLVEIERIDDYLLQMGLKASDFKFK